MRDRRLRTPRTPRERALWVLYADTLTMAVGFYMLVPLLAYHFLQDLGLTVAVVGALTALRSAAQNGMMPFSGWAADRIGYRRAIAGGVLVRALGFVVLGSGGSVPVLVVGSVLAGLGGALFHPASYAAYAALAGEDDRVRVYATRELISNVGFILGPMVGGLLAGLDFRWVAYGSAGLFATAFVLTVLGLPAALTGPATEPTRFGAALKDRRFVRYCVLASGLWLLVSQLYLVVPVRAADVLPGPAGVGLVYTAAAVFMVLVMLPLTGFASRHLPPRAILATGALALGTGVAVMGLWGNLAGLLAGIGVFTIGQMLSQPVMNAVVSDFAGTTSVASYFGVLGLAQAVGGILGNLAGGFLYTVAQGDGPAANLVWFFFLGWGLLMAVLFLRFGPRSAAPA
ncbi:MFS transporter [Paraoerskovia marina]|uniref:MFS transporter n=1 Tax=Paraoerskovia marina TaxID=545619 RepID=UPI0004925279|nr:MFS transporter [Paraoerskovia marina]